METQKLFRDLAIGEQFRFASDNETNNTQLAIPYTKLSEKRYGRLQNGSFYHYDPKYATHTLTHTGRAVIPTGTIAPTFEYEIIEYDVWGNERDGFDVNSAFRTGKRVTFTEEELYTDKLFWRKVKEALHIKPNIRHSSLTTQGDDLVIYVEHEPTGYPLGELQLIETR